MHDLPDAAASAVNGLWISSETADHIFVASGARGLLRVHIVLHEISHMLLDHGRVGGNTEMALRRLLGPALGAVRRGAGRSRYETQEEKDAERLATLILVRANEPPDDDGGRDAGLRKIRQTFGYE
ncbi:hypothetical protein ABZ897_16015 [Nonomuraea sp. NPDC046802]|uniref:hypothetical protein n=1 Tax=Nonomuraea sp. NPDC046802 TaxID=3154919 RepID=UPI0033CC65ED